MIFLICSAFIAGSLHALAPDHWLPFTVVGRARDWTRSHLAKVMLWAGSTHLALAFVLGLLAIHWGFSLNKVAAWDSGRAEVMPYLLTGFGFAFAILALKRKTRKNSDKILFLLVVFGPCEPLIPILFASALKGWHAVLVTSFVFSLATLLTMVLTAQVMYGVPKFAAERNSPRFAGAMAGGWILLAGIAAHVFGI